MSRYNFIISYSGLTQYLFQSNLDRLELEHEVAELINKIKQFLLQFRGKASYNTALNNGGSPCIVYRKTWSGRERSSHMRISKCQGSGPPLPTITSG